jgi:hypothetical protein
MSVAANGIADEYLKRGLKLSPNVLARCDEDTYRAYL